VARILRKSWIDSFVQCVSPHTDAPLNFIRWSAISFIGAALKNHVCFETGTYVVYPNQFIVLVGPPGVGKGTVMDVIEKMNEDTKPNKAVNTINDRVTAEKIIEKISEGWALPPAFVNQQLVVGKVENSCMLFSTEMRVLLGASEWMLPFLEEAWSKSTYDYQTKNKGSVFITDMCCSLLAASVPDFLRNVSREASMVITGGFSSRCLFIYAEKPSKSLPWPEALKKNTQSKALWDDMLTDLKTISNLRGVFDKDTQAKILLENFLIQNTKAADSEDSEAVINFRARGKAHVLKLAMIYSVARHDSLMINGIDMGNAIADFNNIIQTLLKLFRGAGEGMDSASTARVMDFIEKYGRVTRKELLKSLHRHMTAETLDRILFLLEQIGGLKKTEQNKQTWYEKI
jgi:energy-coupling factor transporter ATP-binding protein EcfA2